MFRSVKSQSIQGFTLVELLITVVVAGVLMSIAAPNFSDAMQNSRQTVIVNELMGALRYARSEAIKQSTRTAVCARGADTSCGNDWNQGHIVFVDNGATPGDIDTDETVLRVSTAAEQGDIFNRARLVNTNEEPLPRPFIRFGPRGTSNWSGAGYFIVCDSRGDEFARAINLTLSGDPRRARYDDTDSLINVFGETVSCDPDTA